MASIPTPHSTKNPHATQGTTRTGPKPRVVNITVGNATIRAELLDTPTADRFWLALPIYSIAETWGESIHFETHVGTGRDHTARLDAQPGEIFFWSEEDRVIVAIGPTPISRPGEIRLPHPCNLLATTLDDISALKRVTPSEKVSVIAATD